MVVVENLGRVETTETGAALKQIVIHVWLLLLITRVMNAWDPHDKDLKHGIGPGYRGSLLG